MEANQAQSGLIFPVMDRYKQDDRNTGCIHTYYFIRHLHLHSETQEAEQRHFWKKKKISPTNKPQKETDVFNRKKGHQ